MKLLKWVSLCLLVVLIVFAISYAWRALPIVSGYGAKMLCSCSLLGGRDPQHVIENELGRIPLSLGSFQVDFNDSSASGNVLGLAAKKAVYRKGLGCTLINEMTEGELRNQKFVVSKNGVINQDTIPWPMGNLLPDSLPDRIDFVKLNQLVSNAFDEPGPDSLRKTRSILVVYKGSIIAEKYTDGFNENARQIGWSMTKSVINALIGILVKQGKLDPQQPAPVELWKNDERNKITLNNLLQASSGLAWKEFYGGPGSATNMLFKKKDMGVYAAQHPAKDEPGTKFYYSSGTTNILSMIIRQTVGDEYYHRFPSEALFHKLGIYSMVMEPDAAGNFVGSSYSFATARDWARFGLLYLNDGYFNGEQILPDGWVTYSTTPAPAAPIGEYGAQFWLNAGAPGDPSRRYYPDVPADLYWADGFEGQNVFIIPSRKVVVVKLSLSQGDYLDDNRFLADLLSVLPHEEM